MNLIETLLDGKKKSVILDTDTYNEVDDQYALAYAMLSPDKVNVLAITVAPFKNSRAKTPGEGPVFISHGDCEEDARYLADTIKSKGGNNVEVITNVGTVIGAHSGPGTMALFFVAKQR